MNETRETVEKLKQELQEVRAAAGAETLPASMTEVVPPKMKQDAKPMLSRRARGLAARAAVGGGLSSQLSVDLAGLGLKEVDKIALATAVQTTRAIIAEYA